MVRVFVCCSRLLFTCLPIYPSFCPPAWLSVCSSVRPSISLPTCLSICSLACLPFCPSVGPSALKLSKPSVFLSSIYPSACLSLCFPPLCLPVCLSIPSVHLSVCPSIYPSVCRFICPPACLPVCPSSLPLVCVVVLHLSACKAVHSPSICLPDCPSVCPSVHLSTYLSVHLSFCPSVCLCVCGQCTPMCLYYLVSPCTLSPSVPTVTVHLLIYLGKLTSSASGCRPTNSVQNHVLWSDSPVFLILALKGTK